MDHKWLHTIVLAVVGTLATTVALTVVPPVPRATAYPLNRCAPAENGDPVLDHVNVTQVVDVRRGSARIRIGVEAHDTGGPGVRTGVRAVRVHLSNGPVVNLRYVQSTWWVGYATIRRWSPSGRAWLSMVQLADRAEFPYRATDDDEQAIAYDVTYARSGEHLWSEVTGDRTYTVYSRPDTTYPRMTDLAFAPTAVDTTAQPAVVTLTARATDDLSGMRSVWVTFTRGNGPPVPQVRLGPVAGAAGVLRGELTVPRAAGTSDWQVFSLLVRDRAGNTRSLGPLDILDAGWPRVLHVTSEPLPPTGPSMVVAVTASDAAVDVREEDRSVTYRLRVVNPVSPVQSVGMSLAQPERSWVDFSTAALISGDRSDGIWEIVATVDSCVAGTGSVTPDVSPAVAAGTTVPSFDVLAGDNTDPRLTGRLTGGRIIIDFSEDVNGVSTSSLEVRRTDLRTISGRWSCGPSAVTCAAGPVRTATFTPSGAFRRGDTFLVEANPNHHLELTDRAGNPAHQNLSIR